MRALMKCNSNSLLDSLSFSPFEIGIVLILSQRSDMKEAVHSRSYSFEKWISIVLIMSVKNSDLLIIESSKKN